MQRGTVVELPEHARRRLAELEGSKMQAEDGMKSAQGRINSLPKDAVELRARLAAQRDAQADRHRSLSMIVSRCNQFWMELRGNVALELAPAVEIKLKASETTAAALAATREEIAATQRELAQARNAPLTRLSQQEAVRAHLGRLEQQVRPRVGFDSRGAARVAWAEDMIASKDDLMGILTFILGPDALLSAFMRELEQEPESAAAVSPLEREKNISELSAVLLALERREEALIERAASEGIELPRRGDASPVAVLGVIVVNANARAQGGFAAA